jgi:hypothetical protein
VLRRFYEHSAPKAVVDFEKFTIEHLAPQSGSGEELGKLGNLIYVSETLNNDLGNKPFAAKRPILQAAKEWIPPDVTGSGKWDDAAIVARTAGMAVEGRTAVWPG